MAGGIRSHEKRERVSLASSEKKRIRQESREQVKSIGAELRRKLSDRVTEVLTGRAEWKKAEKILGYLSLPDELDLRGALQQAIREGKTVTLPRYSAAEGNYCAAVVEGAMESLKVGAFGIPEPDRDARCIALNRLDFVLVPGVAFDLNGYRLGRGKGFYDRLLAEVTGVKCGVALDEQVIRTLPVEPHDIAMNFIVTPSRWISIRPAGNE